GVVSWEGDGALFEESNHDINYQIVDRPTQSRKYISRDYIQPQWVFDCMNARIILTTKDNMVGKVPPPHLSPIFYNEIEGYVPEYADTIKRLQAAAIYIFPDSWILSYHLEYLDRILKFCFECNEWFDLDFEF
nr:pescadillo homolog [Tanacetum cinerariifolium]